VRVAHYFFGYSFSFSCCQLPTANERSAVASPSFRFSPKV
jgi:hypothetical protein